MIPYNLNPETMKEFMDYHNLRDQKEVAEMLCISQTYFSLLMSGKRRLNEEMRLRLQIVTRKSQDELFMPNFRGAMPFSHQSLAMGKFYGIYPYDKYSLAEAFQKLDLRD